MSVHWMSWVWKHGPVNSQDRFVLLKLADNADDDGLCFPSIENIIRDTCLSKSAVYRSLSALKNAGWFTLSRGGGRGKTSRYRLLKTPASKSPPKKIETVSVRESFGEGATDINSVPQTPFRGTVNGPPQGINGLCVGINGPPQGKPPHPLKGVTVINRQEPSRARESNGSSPAAVLPSPNAITDEAHMVATEVAKRIGITRWKVREEIVRQAEIELESGITMDALTEAMVTQYKKFRECVKLGRLKFDWGAEKFFGDGLWKNSREWGLKKGMNLDGIVIQ